ncbi:MAG: hypothetical protein FJ271_20355 [Planctomycetes bacterium]|nr:hypothetical protein [Planctomycetota bacterium]
MELLESDEVTTPLVRTRTVQRSSGARKLIIGAVILVLTGGAIAGAYSLRLNIGTDDGDAADAGQGFKGEIRNASNAMELVFRLVVPKTGWQQEQSIGAGLKAIIALQRAAPDVWLAVAARDYGTSKPRKAELVKEAKERLEHHFGETLEWQEKPDDKDFAGQRAQCYEFTGEVRQVRWHGEVRMFAHHGIGYWFFLAAPSLEEAQLALADLQQDQRGFMLADKRVGWRPQPPRTESYRGAKLPIYLRGLEEVWEKHTRPEDVDERGELFLTGRFLQEKDNRKNASVLVIALDKKADLKESFQAARMYFENKIKEEDMDNIVSPVSEKGSALGVTEVIANRPGRRIELKEQRGPQPARYILLAATEAGDHVLAIRCQCTWENRQIWRQDFLDLLGTLQIKLK